MLASMTMEAFSAVRDTKDNEEAQMDLTGKVVLITGAARGIGAATAMAFGQRGAKVVVNYRANEPAAARVVAAINDAGKATGGRAFMYSADARSEEEVSAMVAKTTAEFGPVDILVLNAGMGVPHKPFIDLTHEEFSRKVTGEWECFFRPLKAVLPSMVQRKSGCVIGISSQLSRVAAPCFSAHTTAKSAVDGLMKSLALELGQFGIRVNTVAPGLTVTDATSGQPQEYFQMMARLTPLGRVAQPEDVAGVVVAVASGGMGFVTGAYIPVSGGIQMV